MEDDGGSSIILHIKCYVKISYLDAIMEEWRIFSKFMWNCVANYDLTL